MPHSQPLWLIILSAGLFGVVLIVLIYYVGRVIRILYGNDPRPVRVGYVIRILFGIYLSAIGIFAQCYVIISYFDPTSFSFGDAPEFGASLMSATYFSVATITSTGYGDIHARSEAAMAVASAEMLIGYVMTVVFFSTIAALAFRGRKNDPSPHRRDLADSATDRPYGYSVLARGLSCQFVAHFIAR